jgi:hypothetical protein
MFLAVMAISVVMGIGLQLNWMRQREAWRKFGPSAIRSSKPESAPVWLCIFGERGESRIEIKDATDTQIAEAQRLFPEAVVIKRGGFAQQSDS